jgi:hypothetical protein
VLVEGDSVEEGRAEQGDRRSSRQMLLPTRRSSSSMRSVLPEDYLILPEREVCFCPDENVVFLDAKRPPR